MKTEHFQITKERSLSRGWLYTITHQDWTCRSPSFAVANVPTAEAIRGAIETVINEHTRQEITENFVFDFNDGNGPCRVWLSAENQANYASYLKAVELGVESITLKVNNSIGSVCYAEIKAADYANFYLSLVNHIKEAVEQGWREKDEINCNLLASMAEDL